jgi:hypothetical protein
MKSVGHMCINIIRDGSWSEVWPTCNVSSKTLIGRRFHAIATVRTILFGRCGRISWRVRLHNESGRIDYPLSGDLTYESDALAYLDINAIAVRRVEIVPDRRFASHFDVRPTGRLLNGNSYLSWNWRRVCHQRLWTGSQFPQNLTVAGRRGEVKKHQGDLLSLPVCS